MENKGIYLSVQGRVQGVGFRYFTQQQARRLGLEGFVRNLPDGRVEVSAAGPKDALSVLVDELKKGPPGARVDRCEWHWQEYAGALGSFTVRT